MPELPEVEIVVQELLFNQIVGKKVKNVEVLWPRTVIPTPEHFISLLEGKTIQGIKRRGKYLVFALSDDYFLYVHLRMTGRFTFDPPSHARVLVHLSDGRILYYNDPRKFGRLTLVADPGHLEEKLGLEPLEPDFTLSVFKTLIRGRQRQIKPLLLDQSVIAGLGNIYVDEALWLAKIHPKTLSSSLIDSQLQNLHKAVREVLLRGLETKGTTLGKGKSNFYRVDGTRGSHQDVLSVFRRTGLPCPRCGTPIIRLVVAQRSSHICPTCQPEI